ncbi:MAG: class I SAM-dependent methyltransferase [Methyloversatilis sp.]|nr:class I SAM-dependent methyltransferase [Methyloversatilis sp.]MBP6193185.1 class I SAM-dependent methyltransferase [Methyloversatilis sp.]
MTPADYDAWYESPRGKWIGNTEYRLVLDELAFPAQGLLLDVGCGTGWFTRRLAALPGLHVTGLDLDSEFLSFARSRDIRSSYVQGDALALPFADNSFDYVTSFAALCFTTDWRKAVSEIARVTRKRFAIGMLNRHSLLWFRKGRHGGSGAYRGALWLSPEAFHDGLKELRISSRRMRSAIYLPSGSITARTAERLLSGSRVPWGGFMVLSGDMKPPGEIAPVMTAIQNQSVCPGRLRPDRTDLD